MAMRRDLVIGRYYWVIPAPEQDSISPRSSGPGMWWHDEIQPSRFDGWNTAGEMLWNFMGIDDTSNWPVLWIGDPIDLPVVQKTRGRGPAAVEIHPQVSP